MANILHVSALVLLLAGATGVISAQDRSYDATHLRQPMPERWTFSQEVTQTLPSDDPWWKTFDDATLDSLISMGIDNNYNVSQALHRREIARLAIRQAQSGYYPTLGVSAGYTRSHSGREIDTNAFTAGATLNWEVDVFGRITSQVKSKRAAYNASRAEYVATMVSITSDIATYYINYLVLRNEIAVTREHIQSQKRVVEIAEARHEAGLVSKLDVAQAKTVLYSTQATLPALQAKATQTLNALATLLGVYASDIAPMIKDDAKLPSYQQILPVGIPANLLRRRPDIAEAEAQMAQDAAAIGIAKKDFLPVLSLSGSVGWGGDKVNGMFDSDHFTYSIAPTLSWTIFDGFSRKYALAQAKEQMMTSIDAYNLTVMTAYTEVENAMTSYNAAVESYDLDNAVFQQSHEAFELAMDQYKEGLAAFTNVVNAQIDWLNCANSLVEARGDAIIALIDLYKALGGSPNEVN
ncbi:MAG: TolC family protein [Bacteroides sp.]|nr:TolC family protein [Bacteroides sp.]